MEEKPSVIQTTYHYGYSYYADTPPENWYLREFLPANDGIVFVWALVEDIFADGTMDSHEPMIFVREQYDFEKIIKMINIFENGGFKDLKNTINAIGDTLQGISDEINMILSAFNNIQWDLMMDSKPVQNRRVFSQKGSKYGNRKDKY